jgi:hypothetical protein
LHPKRSPHANQVDVVHNGPSPETQKKTDRAAAAVLKVIAEKAGGGGRAAAKKIENQ